ncbi:1,5-anhydro-D-fructose reductase [Orchesella cincta]|uniref:1,5-anhydro-D-fructose reductase n=1 Tax=Orchesella cincta TaxID=48709 RepID=A0A1D2MCY2_ORCCI|nr:1,5-anhydro-D-fructose reductase [Orchesella cincta]
MSDERVTLKNGLKMPKFGLGCGAITRENTVCVVNAAIDAGCRLFDCALLYGNEPDVGDALKKVFESQKVKREDVFITTKLPMIGNHPSRVEHFLKKSLANLKTDYVDLYLIHFPVGFEYSEEEVFFPREDGRIKLDYSTDIINIWRAMEDQVKAGRTKSIGVSNFSKEQIQRIIDIATEPIANNQLEVHAYFQQKELRKFCKDNGITVSAYAPLGSPGRREAFIGSQGIPQVMSDPIVAGIAEKHGKSTAQVLIRFLFQDDVTALPKSSSAQRITHNFNIFDFTLSTDELIDLRSLDKGEVGRTFNYLEIFEGLDKHPENPLAPAS